jgi:phosphoribosylformylglycinamidine (FGAM) synthase PurS component
MEKQFKKANEHFRENYFDDEIGERIKQKVRGRINESERVVDLFTTEKKSKWATGKKVGYGLAACVAGFGLFIGSAFVSPAMAEVASNIPFLSSIFHSKPVDQVLYEELNRKGYKIGGTGYRVDGKVYSVSIEGSEAYVNKVKEDVKNIAEDILISRGYDDYKIEVIQAPKRDTTPTNDPREQLSDTAMEVVNETTNQLKKQNYSIETIGVGFASPDVDNLTIDITVPDTEKRTEDIKKAVFEGLAAKNINNAEIKFHTVNLKEQEIEGKWTSKILPVIWEGLGNKKEYYTKGFSYSFKDGKFTIIIKTSAEEADAKALAEKIKAAVKDFLNSDDLKSIVNNQPYDVIVKDKHGKTIE